MANATAKVLADDILNWFKGTAFPAAPANMYLALLTAVPTKNDGTGLVEVSGSGYARQPIASSTGWSAIGLNADNIHDQVTNVNPISFPAVVTTGYTVAGLALYDAAAAGNLLAYQSVTSQAMAVGNQYVAAAGAVSLQF